MKKLVITGASSFIGFHLAKKLSKYYSVYATITQPKESYSGIQKKRLEILNKNTINLVHFDVTSPQSIQKVIREIKPDCWINHAGFTKNYGSFDYDIVLADKIHTENLEIIYKELADVGCKQFIGTGTCSEYSDLLIDHRENEECNPSMPYGQSKLKQTLLSLELGKKYKIPTAIIRVFIPIGELDEPKKLFPTVEQKLWCDEEVQLSPGLQERNFVPIEELVYLYFNLLKYNTGYEIYNGASVANMSVQNFILTMARKNRFNLERLKFGAIPLRAGEAPKCNADMEKVQSFLGKIENYQFVFIENINEAREFLKLTKKLKTSPLCVSSNPKASNFLIREGLFVFTSTDFFSSLEHFELSHEVNRILETTESNLLKKFDKDLSFNLIFYFQFLVAKFLFKIKIKNNIHDHFPHLKNFLDIKIIKLNKSKSSSDVLSALSAKLINLILRLHKTESPVILSAHHRFLAKELSEQNKDRNTQLIISTERKNLNAKKVLFNYVNFLPQKLRKKIFYKYFGHPYNNVWDTSSLADFQTETQVKEDIRTALVNEKNVFSYKENIFFEQFITEALVSILPKAITHYLGSKWCKEYFKKNKPLMALHIANTDMARFISALSLELNFPSYLISHGSHAVNDCQEIKPDLIRHARGLILSDESKSIAQSPFASDFLRTCSSKTFVHSFPILWGKKEDKNISIRKKYGIAEDETLLIHASTPKSSEYRRFVFYETPDEYLTNLKDIASISALCDKTKLIIKFRPQTDIGLSDLKEALLPFDHVYIDIETPFLQCLHEADALISFSSTTMEEALQYDVLVIQYSHIFNFSFLPNQDFYPLQTANRNNLEVKIRGLKNKKTMDFNQFKNQKSEFNF